MKKMIIVAVSIITLVSALILPTFADTMSQFQFLYDNRNPEVTPNNILTNPVSDVVLNIPNDPPIGHGVSDLVFGSENYCRVYYEDMRSGVYWYGTGYGSVNVSATAANIRISYTDLYTYNPDEGDSFDLVYTFYTGASVEYSGEWWLVDPSNNDYVTEVRNIQIFCYVLVADYGNAFENQDLDDLNIIYSYPYISGTAYQDGFAAGSDSGYSTGYTVGYDNGDSNGYDRGYSEGVQAGSEGMMDFKNLIFSIFDAPFYVLSTALDFEIFGINVAGTILGLLTLAIIVFIAKLIIVRL